MVYPDRPVRQAIPELAQRHVPGQRLSPEHKERLLAFASEKYADGYSLREIADLIGRSQTVVRRLLDEAGVRRRPPGAPVVTSVPPEQRR